MFALIKKYHKLFICAAVLTVCAVLLTGSTYSWNIYRDGKTNDMQLADLKGKLLVNIPGGDITGLGIHNVSVKNIDNSPVFVRVMVLPVYEIDGVSAEMEIGGQLKADINKSWADGKDGYYYYLDKIEPGEISQEMFSKIDQVIVDSINENVSFSFMVKAEFIGITQYAFRDAWWGGTPIEEQITLDAIFAELTEN